jgi:hypothetical protein
MASAITHFEIYGAEPAKLATFYRAVFGWRIEQMPGVDYWRVETGAPEATRLHGGLMYRAIDGLSGWMLYISVESHDQTVAQIHNLGGSVIVQKTAVPKTAWVTIVADPQGNIFGVWQADAKAFPMPEPE